MKPGDYLLCYLTRVSRWVGVLEVTGEAFFDEAPIWRSRVFPSRVSVRVVLVLRPEHGVPVLDMRGELTVFQNLDNPNRWQGPFRGSPTRWKTADGEAIVRALQEANANPVGRPLGRVVKTATSRLSCRTLPTAECPCRRMTSLWAARNRKQRPAPIPRSSTCS
jgi:hypothetical protein